MFYPIHTSDKTPDALRPDYKKKPRHDAAAFRIPIYINQYSILARRW